MIYFPRMLQTDLHIFLSNRQDFFAIANLIYLTLSEEFCYPYYLTWQYHPSVRRNYMIINYAI